MRPLLCACQRVRRCCVLRGAHGAVRECTPALCSVSQPDWHGYDRSMLLFCSACSETLAEAGKTAMQRVMWLEVRHQARACLPRCLIGYFCWSAVSPGLLFPFRLASPRPTPLRPQPHTLSHSHVPCCVTVLAPAANPVRACQRSGGPPAHDQPDVRAALL